MKVSDGRPLDGRPLVLERCPSRASAGGEEMDLDGIESVINAPCSTPDGLFHTVSARFALPATFGCPPKGGRHANTRKPLKQLTSLESIKRRLPRTPPPTKIR